MMQGNKLVKILKEIRKQVARANDISMLFQSASIKAIVWELVPSVRQKFVI